MLSITIKYIPFNSNTAFLQIKQSEVTSNPYYIYLFYTHVYSAIFCLLAGFTQFNNLILRDFIKIHKHFGKIYVYSVLLFAAPSGIYIGFYANGGITSKVSFILLGIIWFYFTLKGILEIKKGNIDNHKKMMIRSFALAFSAITLRLWKVVLVYLFEPNPMDVYRIIAWLGWIPNIVIIELYLYKKTK
jgi:uncharacterized membrane protein